MAQSRSYEDFDDNAPTQLMRREEPASAVLPTVRPVRARPASVKLRRTLATTRPPTAQASARAAAHAPTERPEGAPVPDPPDTAPLPRTLPEVPSRKRSVTPAMLPPWGDDPHATRGRPPSSSFTTYAAASEADPRSVAPRPEPSPSPLPLVSVAQTSAPPVQMTYRPLSLDLEPSRNDPGATQPSRRQRIEAASRRNWAAMAICGGFLAGLIGSAVPFVASMTPGAAPARSTRIHVTTPNALAMTTSARVKAVEVEEGAPLPLRRRGATASATSAKAGGAAKPSAASAEPAAAPVVDAHAAAFAAPAPEPPAPEPPRVDDAKPADLNGRDLLSDGL